VVLQKFDAARIVDLIEAHGVTTFTATTLMLQRIADLPGVDDRDLGSIVWILQGAPSSRRRSYAAGSICSVRNASTSRTA
jgi:acyl-CoA synthetase (AMP-forming)/AMP-acid ligase II